MTIRLQAQTRELPHAVPSEVTAPFWNGCARGELMFQRCARCRTITFPPREHCRGCLAREQQWEPSAGRGALYSWTVVHRPVTPAFEAPYAAAIVTLDEGYQMLTNVIDAAPEDLRADLPVHVSFRRTGDDLWLPYFVPA